MDGCERELRILNRIYFAIQHLQNKNTSFIMEGSWGSRNEMIKEVTRYERR